MSANFRGTIYLCIAMACFAFSDATIKLALETLTLGQLIVVRGVMASTLLLIMFHRSLSLSQIARLRHPAVILRNIGELGATISYLLGLMHLTIGFVTAIFQALPLAVTAGAAFFFAEPVGWRRWTAVTVGFVGILIIVRPGFEGFSAWSLATLLSVLFSAMRDLSTRSIPREISSGLLSLLTAIVVTIFGTFLIEPLGGWQPLTLENLTIILAAALFLIGGYHCLILAMREGEISFMAPFRYTGLLWAIALGYLIFHDIPDWLTILGSTIVVCSGLYAIYRERIVNRSLPITKSTSPGMAPDGL